MILHTWYTKKSPIFEEKECKSVIHDFTVKGRKGLTINPYQGCGHRCGYCYATYEWSPEFYNRIYAKSNVAGVLEKQLKSRKYQSIDSVMISSATDAYQPAEVKYGLTRKCIEVLQRYNVPYYVFTKSKIIERDLKLHQRFRDNCFLVWSITTTDENIRRLIEPGTPPANSMFNVIRRFTDAGVCCCVNIDPLIPLITAGSDNVQGVLDRSYDAGVRYVYGALLRLRSDIWERMKIILKLLHLEKAIEEYKNAIYRFEEPLKLWSNIGPIESYETEVLQNLRELAVQKGMILDFPDIKRNSRPNSNKHHAVEQDLILKYL
ncbi:MAG TPA: radical SAM protein [Candidatus Bathyarchaeia archaeon]|nr:radical SAM protein [Candidatus Bathyarchaeia archaeon]